MVNNLLFPKQFEAQFAEPIAKYVSFDTYVEMQAFIVDAETAPLAYSGQIATCKNANGSIFELDSTKTNWLEHKYSIVNFQKFVGIPGSDTYTITNFIPDRECLVFVDNALQDRVISSQNIQLLTPAIGGEIIKVLNVNSIVGTLQILTPIVRMSGIELQLFFNIPVNEDSIGYNIIDLTLNVNGTPIVLDTEYAEGYFQNGIYFLYPTTPIEFDDVLTIDFVGGHWHSTTGIFLDSFTNVPVINDVQEPVTVITTSVDTIFTYAHGTCQHNDKFYIGTRTEPSKLVVFNDPSDLTDFTSVTMTGYESIECMVYDTINNRIYASTTAKILSINPLDITDFTVVYNSGLSTDDIMTIATDGVYVYIGTGAYATCQLRKLRISDWTVVAQVTVAPTVTNLHAATLQIYTDRTEIYFTNAYLLDEDITFIKVNGTDLSYTVLTIPNMHIATDDLVSVKYSNIGANVYFGSETYNTLIKVDTGNMTYSLHDSRKTWGVFSDGSNLFVMGNEGCIVKFTDFDLNNPITKGTLGQTPNEFFYSSTGQLFYTNFDNPSRLTQFTI